MRVQKPWRFQNDCGNDLRIGSGDKGRKANDLDQTIAEIKEILEKYGGIPKQNLDKADVKFSHDMAVECQCESDAPDEPLECDTSIPVHNPDHDQPVNPLKTSLFLL